MKKYILASASPRRKELLSQIGIAFRIDVSNAEEKTMSDMPGTIVMDLSYLKAMEVFKRQSEDVVVIGADTIVYANGKVLGKPKDVQDAYEMIHTLQGAVHQVYTGVTFVWQENTNIQHASFYEMTEVELYPMSDEEIQLYIAMKQPYDKARGQICDTTKKAPEWADKAGGYAIQGTFAKYVKRINGDYYNVVGLPVSKLYQVLRSLNLI